MIDLQITGRRFTFHYGDVEPDLIEAIESKYQRFVSPMPGTGWQIELERKASDQRPSGNHAMPPFLFVNSSGWSIRHSLLSAELDPQHQTGRAHLYGPIPHPVENLLRFILCETLPAQGGGLFHAAGLDLGGFGVLVAAPSEFGKTTLSRIFGPEHVLTDEMPAVTKTSSGYRIHATPFWGEMGSGMRNDSLPLKALVMLDGKGSRIAEHVDQATMLQRLFATAFLYSDSAKTQSLVERTCAQLVASLPCIRFSFNKAETREDILARLIPLTG